MKQSAVEWLIEELKISLRKEIEQALEMEKQQIINAHLNGQAEFDNGAYRSEIIKHSEQYYNEKFKK